jgi:hypothetical protein
VIHVIAGEAAASPAEPLRYTPQTEVWETFESPVAAPWSAPGLVSMEAFVYAAGGRLDGSPSAEIRSYQAIFTILIPTVR